MADLLKGLPKIKIAPKVYRALPESAGIYVFFTKDIPIYIGKAINLKRRVSSYFDLELEGKTARMISEADNLSYIQVSSELEALLLEAGLIRKYLPHYNIAAKDDKHPLYIQITDEEYPRIITVRKTDLNKGPSLANYGPFPSSGNVRAVLRLLRRIFPFSDHKLGKRACLYFHIGLCNPCPNVIEGIKNRELRIRERKKYVKNIKHMKTILDGEIGKVKSEIVAKMEKFSKSQNFENAARLRDQIMRLEYITSPQMPTEFYMQNPNLYEDVRKKEMQQLVLILKKFGVHAKTLIRIECFDVAHLAGTKPTASMVTFINGEADKSFYRHFRIRQLKGQDDYESMREVIKRRKKHFGDWGRPDLIMVDGGSGQVAAFATALRSDVTKIPEIPVVGIAKNPDRLVVGKNKIKLSGAALNLVQRIRDEAHRFARLYHHKLVSKELTAQAS